jgi:hypothetical protein
VSGCKALCADNRVCTSYQQSVTVRPAGIKFVIAGACVWVLRRAAKYGRGLPVGGSMLSLHTLCAAYCQKNGQGHVNGIGAWFGACG